MFKPCLRTLILAMLILLSACEAASIEVPPQPRITHAPTLSPVSTEPSPQEEAPTHTATPTLSNGSSATTTGLTGPYLGQEPPGMEPKIFAPGIVSDPDSLEYSGAFSPDGSEYYFYRISGNLPSRLLFTRVIDGKWSEPEEPAFSRGYGAFEPYIGFDNQRLYFAWTKPVPSRPSGLPEYFFVERTPDGWSEPEYAGQGMFVSSSQDGQFYTTDMSSRNIDGKTYLARIILNDGIFTSYERLQIRPHWGSQAHPCIAPDGSYILFDVEDGSHLYISFKNPDGTWGEAIDLTLHGFDPRAGGPYVSPDGKYLFFGFNQDIWWVDIGVVGDLRPTE